MRRRFIYINTLEMRKYPKSQIKGIVTTQTLDREGGIIAVNEVLDTIKKAIEGFKGKFAIKEEARIVTDIDDEKKRGEGEDDEEESEEDEDEEEDEDDDGLMAPKGLDQQVDAEEASRDNRKKNGDDEESEEDDD